jgi:maltooligosyltrehalose trehalohydrolase
MLLRNLEASVILRPMSKTGLPGGQLSGGGGAPWRLARGATVEADGGVTFSVWAPRCASLAVRLFDGRGGTRAELPMRAGPDGVHAARAAAGVAGAGDDYAFVLPDVGVRPDPVSRLQAAGVHGPSRVVAPDAFPWTDGSWTGLPRADLVFYELHVGTFTPEGTFAGVARKLPYLRDLGVTAVELMPVVAFPGDRNWGYDGVFPYAPHAAYGGPDGLKALVDACHAHGMALFLDVVYNHLGPEGNYLGAYAPYFSDRYRTPWGDAVNFDGPDSDEVRRYFVDNACYWLAEYHVDGLRLDAIHGIFDFGAQHVLEEMTAAFAALAGRLGRRAWLVAESDLNDPRVIRDAETGGLGFDAQWSDDFHHALHAVLTGARRGYFGDFGRMADLAKAITAGFVYDGQHAPHRRRRHGASAAAEAGDRFVTFIQNHDQVANAYQGRRLAVAAGRDRQKVAAAILMSTPGLPLLFQGEEYGEEAPFDYFTSHGDPALVQAVRAGRHAEYLHLLEEGAGIEAWTDPQDEATLERSKLRWSALETAAGAEMHAFYRALLALRRGTAALANGRKDLCRVAFDEGGRWLSIARGDPRGGGALTLANLGPAAADVPVPDGAAAWRLALATRPDLPLPSTVHPGARLTFPPATAAVFAA